MKNLTFVFSLTILMTFAVIGYTTNAIYSQDVMKGTETLDGVTFTRLKVWTRI